MDPGFEGKSLRWHLTQCLNETLTLVVSKTKRDYRRATLRKKHTSNVIDILNQKYLWEVPRDSDSDSSSQR
jgi:hypothetical protein